MNEFQIGIRNALLIVLPFYALLAAVEWLV